MSEKHCVKYPRFKKEMKARKDRYSFHSNTAGQDISCQLMEKAVHCLKCKDYPKAERYLAKILRSNPGDISSISKIIKCFSRMNLIYSAEKKYHSALNMGVESIFIHNSMMDAYAKAGLLEKAEEIYCNKLGKHPNVVSHTIMITAYAKAGLLEKAEEIYHYKIGKHATSVSRKAMAYAYYTCGRYQDALNFLKSLPARSRDSLSITLVQLDILRKMGKREDALNELNAILQGMAVDYSNPLYVRARTIQAYCQNSSGAKEAAYQNLLDLYLNVSPYFKNYPRILCGLVFAYEGGALPNVVRLKIKESLINLPNTISFSKGLKADVERALHLLNQKI
ncbi:MAG: hypothetical protein V1822_02955 [Candidatus Micrarchaeota archaeon]